MRMRDSGYLRIHLANGAAHLLPSGDNTRKGTSSGQVESENLAAKIFGEHFLDCFAKGLTVCAQKAMIQSRIAAQRL